MKKNNTDLWDTLRGKIVSANGGWQIGKGVFCHGYSMMDELVGRATYMQVLVLNATGRLPDKPLSAWFEAIHICLSWPDPRIWCNQIGALGGTARTSAIAATTAGILANDARIYGTGTLPKGMEFIQQAMERYQNGYTADEIVTEECAKHGGKPHIMGYARPIAQGDERVSAMRRVQKELELPIDPHQQLAMEIEQVLLDKFGESMNINGYMSAFLCDQGYTPDEAYRIFSVLVNSGITACYIDAVERPAETFLPLRCDDINYQGKPPREVPSA